MKKFIYFALLLKRHIKNSMKGRIIPSEMKDCCLGNNSFFHGATNPTVPQVFNRKVLILFCSVSKEYVYSVNSLNSKRRVI